MTPINVIISITICLLLNVKVNNMTQRLVRIYELLPSELKRLSSFNESQRIVRIVEGSMKEGAVQP